MKKLLLFSLAIGFALSLSAQNKMEQSNERHLRVADGQEIQLTVNHPPSVLNANPTKTDVQRIVVGTATGQRGLRREEVRLVSYVPDLDIITVSMIVEPGVYEGIDDDGTVVQFYSTDEGLTWEGPVVLNNDDSEGLNYYLSGSTFNPAGNTDITSAIGVHQGTLLPPGDPWNFKVFGSSTLGGENQTNYLFEESNTTDYPMNGYFNWFALGQVNDEMRCLNLYPKGAWSTFTEIALEPQVGTFDGTEFDWEIQDAVDMELILADDGLAEWEGRWQGRDAATEIAWSADGMTGYMWVIGVSENDYSGYQPVLYNTTNGGDDWDYVYMDFQTDEAQDMLEEITPTNWAGYRTPRFTESCGVVNINGELEIFANIGAHSADIFDNPDSLGWGWVYPGDVVNFTVNIEGEIVDIIYVDSLLTDNVLDGGDDADIAYTGTTGWNHRLQAARNVDGSQVFVTWSDTRTADAEKNEDPDLFGWSKGYDSSGDIQITDPISFTEGTIYETYYYYNSSADLAYDNGSGYTIPTIQGITPNEFDTNGSASGDPITVNYITGIEFPELTVGLSEIENTYSFSVSQNMPNPFTGSTTINVSTQTPTDVTVKVSNIIGQTIYTLNAGTINGTQEIVLPAENLEAGIYFYTVRVGNESISKKMMVE